MSAPRMAAVSAGRSSVSPRTSVNPGRRSRGLEEALLAGREIVEGDDGVAVREQPVDQGAADETSSAGDECAHARIAAILSRE